MASSLTERDEIKKKLMATPTETTPTKKHGTLPLQEGGGAQKKTSEEATPTGVDADMERELEEKSVSEEAYLCVYMYIEGVVILMKCCWLPLCGYVAGLGLFIVAVVYMYVIVFLVSFYAYSRRKVNVGGLGLFIVVVFVYV